MMEGGLLVEWSESVVYSMAEGSDEWIVEL